MSARTAPAMTRPPAFERLETGRLTTIGLTLAAIGWALLLGAAATADLLTGKAGRAVPPTFHADLVDIAKCIIGSGFALAVVGALQQGFGALNRFFEAVLLRSAQRVPATETARPMPAEPATPMPAAPGPAKRPRYRTMPDGSVEVETIVGTRKFGSFAEAREFI